MTADLHIHSVYSDGLCSPDVLCKLAKSRGLSLLSITDHDTLAGLDVKRAAAARYGLTYLSGWEISAYAGDCKIHVLGYGCSVEGEYERFNAKRKAAASARAMDSVEKFRALGIPLTYEDVLAQRASDDLPVHTMHVARAAAVYLGIRDGDVYSQYLAAGKPANSNIGRPTPEEAIDCIHAAGGFASIAHPGRIDMPIAEREATLRKLAAYGADGIEAVYTTHTKEETSAFSALANELGLMITGGSDTHYEDETHAVGSPIFVPSKELLSALKLI